MGVLNKLLKFFSRSYDEYPYLIEIRPMLEKYKIKRQIRNIVKTANIRRWHKVPHITLVYNFRLKKDVRDLDIAEIIQNIAYKYSVVRFYYDGFELKKGSKGYVFAFKIKPSCELKKLREKIYNEMKPFIVERPDVMNFNNAGEDEFWFHATIGYRLSRKKCDILRNVMRSYVFRFPAFALRITLLKKSKIAYEYDIPSGKLLSRKDALSRKYYAETVKRHRKALQIEASRRHSSPRESRIWFISDTHFDHANIIKYCARPFVDVKEMNEVLMKNWNNMIRREDIVYFLGDMSFGKRSPSYWIRKLNGKIIYIKGNHDRTKIGKNYEVLAHKGHRFLLIHNPECVDSFDGWIIHGHKHNNDLIRYPFINGKKRTINVSVEVINYKPVSLYQIIHLYLHKERMEIMDVGEK